MNFFETEFSLLMAPGPPRIGLPGKVDIGGLLHSQILVALNQDWQPSANIPPIIQGSVVAFNLDAVHKDPLVVTDLQFLAGPDTVRTTGESVSTAASDPESYSKLSPRQSP